MGDYKKYVYRAIPAIQVGDIIKPKIYLRNRFALTGICCLILATPLPDQYQLELAGISMVTSLNTHF